MAKRRKKRWIGRAVKRKRRGALHRQLGIPARKKIPVSLLRRAARAIGKLGRRARLALTLRRFGKRTHRHQKG